MFIQDLNIIINQCLIRRFLNHIRTKLIITTLSLGELIEMAIFGDASLIISTAASEVDLEAGD